MITMPNGNVKLSLIEQRDVRLGRQVEEDDEEEEEEAAAEDSD